MHASKAEEDLASSIRLLAESGPLGVPLSCLARRALPSVAPAPLVCLDGRAGGVMLAATARSCLRISNAGALAVDYTVQVRGACRAAAPGLAAGCCASCVALLLHQRLRNPCGPCAAAWWGPAVRR